MTHQPNSPERANPKPEPADVDTAAAELDALIGAAPAQPTQNTPAAAQEEVIELPDPTQVGEPPPEPQKETFEEQELPVNPQAQNRADAETLVRWAVESIDLGQVELTEPERDAFLASILSDTPFSLRISTGSKLPTLTFRALSTYEYQQLFALLSDMDARKEIQLNLDHTGWLQLLSVVMQLQRIDDADVALLGELKPSTEPAERKRQRDLWYEKAMQFSSGSRARYAWMLKGLRIFEIKRSIGEKNLGTDAFFEHGGTAS